MNYLLSHYNPQDDAHTFMSMHFLNAQIMKLSINQTLGIIPVVLLVASDGGKLALFSVLWLIPPAVSCSTRSLFSANIHLISLWNPATRRLAKFRESAPSILLCFVCHSHSNHFIFVAVNVTFWPPATVHGLLWFIYLFVWSLLLLWSMVV